MEHVVLEKKIQTDSESNRLGMWMGFALVCAVMLFVLLWVGRNSRLPNGADVVIWISALLCGVFTVLAIMNFTSRSVMIRVKRRDDGSAIIEIDDPKQRKLFRVEQPFRCTKYWLEAAQYRGVKMRYLYLGFLDKEGEHVFMIKAVLGALYEIPDDFQEITIRQIGTPPVFRNVYTGIKFDTIFTAIGHRP